MRVLLMLILIGLLVLGISNSNDGITIADNTSVPDKEVTSNETSNSSTGATITITMYTVADDLRDCRSSNKQEGGEQCR